jgi:hypothetical protein
MKKPLWILVPFVIVLLSGLSCAPESTGTVVSIRGDRFFINGKPTYAGRTWDGYVIEGLLFNSRMVQGIFDDLNPRTRELWNYPDTGEWNPGRNTREFVEAMAEWRAHGLLAFTLNLQGGSPTGYSNQDWVNSAFDPDGGLRPDYLNRLEQILGKADDLGMVVLLGLFYFGQDQHLRDEAAVVAAVDNIMGWLFESGYRHILIEVNNECDVRAYDHEILKPDRVHELILRVKNRESRGYRFPAGTSYGGGSVPDASVVQASDFILLHGNGVKDPRRIVEMVEQTRQVEGYTPKPIVFNEDDHYDFDQPFNNFAAAVQAYASWGFFDYRRQGEDFADGFQSVPVDWKIRSERKLAFFEKLKEITGDSPRSTSDVAGVVLFDDQLSGQHGLSRREADQVLSRAGQRCAPLVAPLAGLSGLR